MIPRVGLPLKFWDLNPGDFPLLVDANGNGLNVQLLCATWFALLKDSPIDGLKPFRQGMKLYNALVGDLKGTIVQFASLADKLTRSAILHETRGTIVTPMFREFARTPLFKEYHYWYKFGDPEVLSYMLTFLYFGKKAEYNDPSLIEAAVQSWLNVEYKLQKLQLPAHVLDDLRVIVSQQDLVIKTDELVMRHGPGTVAEPGVKTTEEKNNTLQYDSRIDKMMRRKGFFMRKSPYDTLVLPNTKLWGEGYNGKASVSRRISRLVFVRKTIKSMRSICKEPKTNQYAQQGVLNALKGAIKRSGFRHLIDIEDQSKNRFSAQLASERLDFATLDLSAASDSVSWELVKRIFSDDLVGLLDDTRTESVEMPNGYIFDVAKFAPMGSAVCFPVQSIIFSSVLLLSNYLHSRHIDITEYLEGDTPRIDSYVPDAPQYSCVYGDDIICRDEQAAAMISLLTALGFSVNEQKSFFGPVLFRESCGMYAYCGDDVSPLMFKVENINDDTHESRMGRIALANSLYHKGYVNARGVILRSIDSKFYCYVDPDSPYSRYPWSVHGTETNRGKRSRYNPPIGRLEGLFRNEVKVLRPRWDDGEDFTDIAERDSAMVIYRKRRDTRSNCEARYRYGLYLCAPFIHEGASHLPPSAKAALSWDWRWTPIS